MTSKIVFVGVFLAILLREVTRRTVARAHPPQLFVAFVSFFFVVVCCCTWPWFSVHCSGYWALVQSRPMLAGVACLKAVAIWSLICLGQRLRRESVSAGIYVFPIGTGLTAVMNYLLFAEVLTTAQWMAALGLAVLGVCFAAAGHLSRLDSSQRWTFLLAICICPVLGGCDIISLRAMHWYPYLFSYAIPLCLLSQGMLPDKRAALSLLRDRGVMTAGIVFAGTEMFILSILVVYLPVSTMMTASCLAVPVMMTIAALIWDEGTVGNQLLFGLLAALACVSLFL